MTPFPGGDASVPVLAMQPVTARRLKEMNVTTADELPPIEPVDTVPRVLKQAGLMGIPEDATTEEPDPVVR